MGIYRSNKQRFHLKNARFKKHQKRLKEKAIEETLAKIDGVLVSFEGVLTSIDGVSASIKDASVSIEEAFVSIEEASASIEEALVSIEESSKEPQRTELISTIRQLPEEELPSANQLISTMRYPKGPNEGKIISPYLQKKTYDYLSQSLYKPKSDYYSLQNSNLKLKKTNNELFQKNQKLIKRTQSLGAKAQHIKHQKSKHIAEIRSLVRRSKQITNEEFREKVKTIFNPNKNFYSSNTIWLATNILQVGEMSLRSTVECMRLFYEFLVGEPPRDWLSSSTLRTWHKNISELQFNEQIYQVKNALAFGIMVDESTRGQLKNLILCYQYWDEKNQLPNVIVAQLQNVIKCNANTVSDVIINHIQEYGLDIKKCIVWTTDNTSYMSSDKKGAVALFNKKVNGNSLRIGCGLHIIQIIMNHFEQEAFGTLANTTGFSRKPHLYNLLYLAWKLHDGYDSSDRDKPLNINSQIIRNLYDGLLGFHYNQYQLPLRTRWGYELRTAKQYVD